MGLIKAAKSAIESTMHEQWKEAIRCEDMGNDVLMVRKTTETGVISNGSTIIVAPGQCAVIFDNGKVIDATAEDGIYTFDTSSTPSFFAGQFKETFKEMWQRFTYNGATAKEQYVFYFNLKEITENKFGTQTPINYQDWSHPIPNKMTNSLSPLSVKVRCYGVYSFRISNPALFMQMKAGTADVFRTSSITEQMRSEVTNAFQNILNELGDANHKVPVLELSSNTDEIKEIMNERVFDEPIRARGLQLVSFSIGPVTLDEASEQYIKDYEFASNDYLQQAKITSSYANAVENAAQNAHGAATGFMGIGMVNMASNGMVGGTANNVWQNPNNGGNTISVDPYANNVNQTNENNRQSSAQAEAEEPILNQSVANQSPVAENNSETMQPTPINNIPEAEKQPEEKQSQVVNQLLGDKDPALDNSLAEAKETVGEFPMQNDVEETAQDEVISNSSETVGHKMCLKCGNINPANAKFCNNCGNQLN